MRSAKATSHVGAPVTDVFTFLADLRNHWRLAGPWIEVLQLTPDHGHADGATVRLRGPLGLVVAARTSVYERREPTEIRGSGKAGGSLADVVWSLGQAGPDRTQVAVEVQLRRATPHHRAIWLLGGAIWLQSRLSHTVSELEHHVQAHATATETRPGQPKRSPLPATSN